ncbi:aromatic amino acid DMT transporter YddG [Neisseria perflava]|uniref:aromatic amino acid DMT transporter YddG n=1 Tax=Neisseria perflava TaxID=33053 RepID=UPI00209CBFF0|nr:aromatic amino acid DMT transporter YddG [Neisseria perflava]MCP1660392.1 drug/metabolite transporter (DMT)-like permease [Neisseria perflava]MCP1772075.1 drug/metabolite transporter (DMT)-like permease [Neisseria perflava]
MDKNKATFIGFSAILLWSAVISLIHILSGYFGAVGGAAVMYSVATVVLLLTGGVPRIHTFPRAYLLWGGLLFVAYELCLSLSVGYAQNARQAVEVGMVNYLWPALTVMASILFNGQKAKWWVVFGLMMSFAGIAWVLGGEQGLDWRSIAHNISINPASYLLALLGAFIWAAYCVITVRIQGKKNAVTFFLGLY